MSQIINSIRNYRDARSLMRQLNIRTKKELLVSLTWNTTANLTDMTLKELVLLYVDLICGGVEVVGNKIVYIG